MEQNTKKPKSQRPKAGGQAVIEGVMMRSEDAFAMAVRKPDGDIEVVKENYTSLAKRKKLLGLPLIRGFIGIVEMLYFGMKYLELSARIASPDDERKETVVSRLISFLVLVVAFAAAVALFAYLPLLVSSIAGLKQKPFLFNLFAGFVRVVLFIVYIVVISFVPDIRRVFQYHGAEHKVINAYEHGEPVEIASTRKYTTYHPRCGTSFILVMVILAILFYALVDGILYSAFGIAMRPFYRMLYHILLLPIVFGIAYEFLKIGDNLPDESFLFKLMTYPGMWLQRITTKPPDDSMIETAVVALKAALGEDAGSVSVQGSRRD
ncbi:DUF1385 domain-containing protein [bacterium]|nr:MAG: DUF1385 domain-containing protein [bacterium]